jgi:hypothetical protein
MLVARIVTDFAFYFFLFWLPQYPIDERGFDLWVSPCSRG